MGYPYPLYTLSLPRTFWEDHYDRCGDQDGTCHIRIIRSTARLVVAELDNPALEDLMSDADLYATPGQFDNDYRSLCRSAAATLAAIKRQYGLAYKYPNIYQVEAC